jgi:secreted trypsin-like serine protease
MATALSTMISAIAPDASDAACPRRHARAEVIGGFDVADCQYPFVAGTGYADASGAFFWHNQICGGSLIAPSSVLRAAHCVVGADSSKIDYRAGLTPRLPPFHTNS